MRACAQRANEVQRRVVARAKPFYFARGDFQTGFLDAHAETLFFRAFHPLFHRARLRWGELQRGAQRQQSSRQFSDDLLQHLFLDFQVILGGEALRGRQVIACLRFMRVGDGGSAHFEVTFGLRQLFRDGGELGGDEGQTVLRCQDVKIGLRYAHNQIEVGLRKSGFRLCDLIASLFVCHIARPVEQRLGEGDAVAVGVALSVRVWQGVTERNLEVVHLRRHGGADSGQYCRPSLRQALQPGIAGCARRCIGRIVAQRVAVNLQQVGCMRRTGQGRCDKPGGAK